MASLKASWFSSFPTISHPNGKKSHTFKRFRLTFSLTSSNDEASSDSGESASETEQVCIDPVKLAFAKAKEYKKLVQSIPKVKVEQNPVQESDNDNLGGTMDKEMPDSVKIAMAKAKEYKKSGQLSPKLNIEQNPVQDSDGIDNRNSGETKEMPDSVRIAMAKAKEYKKTGKLSPKLNIEQNPVQDSDGIANGNSGETKEMPDSVRIAMEKAREYKKSGKLSPKLNIEQNPVQDSDVIANGNGGEAKELPDSVRIAMEKAKEYTKNKGNVEISDRLSGLEKKFLGNSGGGTMEKKGELSISSIDFVGLNFADKKTGRALPAGLVPISDPFPEGDIPEVEIIVGDTSKFADGKSPKRDQVQENESDDYKPKVSTWGVFPRPSNISKTFGGGRSIKPGEALETTEEKAAREAHTKELIAAYKRRTGKYIDPKLKSECEESLKEGDSLMNVGKLSDALPYYQKVMDKLPFQSELHGLAALQWSICLDSLRRTNEARVMYERLQRHPNAEVNKKARQFMFSFQAMEMMKVTASSPDSLKNIGYQNYFEAFVEKKTNYPFQEAEEEVISLNQTLPYILLIISPIFLVLLAAVRKRI